MSDNVLLGRGDQMISLPRSVLDQHLAQVPEHSKERLGFMSADHHLVRVHAVQELAKIGQPLKPESISSDLKLPLGRVTKILDDLEAHLFFLVRNREGEVNWAFPVAAERTPHALTISSKDRCYAA